MQIIQPKESCSEKRLQYVLVVLHYIIELIIKAFSQQSNRYWCLHNDMHVWCIAEPVSCHVTLALTLNALPRIAHHPRSFAFLSLLLEISINIPSVPYGSRAKVVVFCLGGDILIYQDIYI